MSGLGAIPNLVSGNRLMLQKEAVVFVVAVVATKIIVAGWVLTEGIGLADAIWGDRLYNILETKKKYFEYGNL